MTDVNLTVGMQGRYRLVARKAVVQADGSIRPGRVTRKTPWFDNIITDAGLELMGGTVSVVSACQVGTGNATPSASDVQLQTRVAGTTNPTIAKSSLGTTPYYSKGTFTFRFVPGTATGNISEVGVGVGPSNTDHLFSRALVLDGGGSPTTITVLADEYLDVAYELRFYPPLTDDVTSITINGTSYTITTRAADVTSATAWANYIGTFADKVAAPLSGWRSGAVGATVVDHPSGTPFDSTSTKLTYSANSHRIDIQVATPLSLSFTAQSFVIFTTIGEYQMGISPSISKDNTQILTFIVRISWARKTI